MDRSHIDEAAFEQIVLQHFGGQACSWAPKLKAALDARDYPYHAYLNWFMRKAGVYRHMSNIVCSAKTLDTFEEHFKTMREKALTKMNIDTDIYGVELRIWNNDIERVLSDKQNELSPLFRYITAAWNGLDAVASANQENATRQALSNEYFFEVYAGMEPYFPVTREEAV